MKNEYFETCPYCGAHLDPGERCDCKESRNAFAAELYEKHYGKAKKEADE